MYQSYIPAILIVDGNRWGTGLVFYCDILLHSRTMVTRKTQGASEWCCTESI
ncbi:hypothetical protein PAHAL_9G371200 [Panicum hallii]|uniref:Uncharacterized protein n=1 Tax=Panicum hallii TaxID=206008 RepID=A0A2T8I3R6_9POAL|nr:hypothetical protein PAHAL_9G371200 [Panicum hallii]